MTNVDHAIDTQPARRSVLTDELLIVDKGGVGQSGSLGTGDIALVASL
jgi:hypothetical protein